MNASLTRTVYCLKNERSTSQAFEFYESWNGWVSKKRLKTRSKPFCYCSWRKLFLFSSTDDACQKLCVLVGKGSVGHPLPQPPFHPTQCAMPQSKHCTVTCKWDAFQKDHVPEQSVSSTVMSKDHIQGNLITVAKAFLPYANWRSVEYFGSFALANYAAGLLCSLMHQAFEFVQMQHFNITLCKPC